MIRLYWYNKKPNFGDELSPVICKMLSGQEIEYTESFESCDILAIGSILEHVKDSSFQGYVWGSGFISGASDVGPLSNAVFKAVRGRLTAEKLNLGGNVSVGDPGLLAHMLYPSNRQTTEIGLIPHFVDSQNKKLTWIAKNSDNIKIIDIQAGIFSVVKEVSDCRFIVASCLHGLILADALGIPNSWMQLSDKVIGKGFKFRDYYSVFGIHNPKPISVHWWDSAKSIKRKIGKWHRPGIGDLQKGLINSFPYRHG